jgi:hypothetical protein
MKPDPSKKCDMMAIISYQVMPVKKKILGVRWRIARVKRIYLLQSVKFTLIIVIF